MKNNFPEVYTILLFASLFTQSCNPSVKFTSLAPAAITVPDSTKIIVFVNRTKPEKNGWNTVEAVLSNERLGQDKEAVGLVMSGLQNRLLERTNFTLIREEEIYVGPRSGSNFPEPFAWSDIDAITKKYGAHLVVALEVFDSDFSNFTKSDVINVKTSTGTVKKTIEYPYQRLRIYAGFRIYDPAGRRLVDEFKITDKKEWMVTQPKTLNVYNPQKQEAIRTLSKQAGYNYGSRFLPTISNCNRTLLKNKCTQEIKDGTKMATSDQWDGAMEKWNSVINDPNADNEQKGKAAYNLAVAYEKKGKLKDAMKWAEESAKYGNKNANNYISVLKKREEDDKLLWQQLSNENLLK